MKSATYMTGRAKRRVLMQRLAGFLAVIFIFIGRWTPGRALSDNPEEQLRDFLREPRFYIVVLLVVVAASLRRRSRPEKGTTATAYRKRAQVGLYAGTQQRDLIVQGLLMAFLGYHALSVAWAVDSDLAVYKAYEVILIALSAASIWACLRSAHSEEFRKAFWFTLVLIGGTLAAIGFSNFGASGVNVERSTRATVLGGGPNVFGRNMGMLLLVLVFLAISGRQFLAIPASVVTGLLVVISGSRGSMAGVVAGLIVLVWLMRPQFTRMGAVIVAVSISVTAAAVYTPAYDQAADLFEERVGVLFDEELQLVGRDIVFGEAIECAARNPLIGAGLGGFEARESPKLDTRHPHNVELEALCEGGSIGLLLFLALILNVGRAIWVRRSALDPRAVAILAMFFVAIQVSGDFFDSRGFFLILPLAVTPFSQASEQVPEPTPASRRFAVLGRSR